MDLRGPTHVAVAGDLREDRRRSDRRTLRVTVDHGALFVTERTDSESVDKADRVLARNALERAAQRVEVRAMKPARVDPANAAHDHGRPRRRPQHERVELLAAGLVVLLRVVQAGECTTVGQRELLEVEQDRRGHERPSETAAPRLVRTSNEALAERAIEGE
jgi:hypothetical protein